MEKEGQGENGGDMITKIYNFEQDGASEKSIKLIIFCKNPISDFVMNWYRYTRV